MEALKILMVIYVGTVCVSKGQLPPPPKSTGTTEVRLKDLSFTNIVDGMDHSGFTGPKSGFHGSHGSSDANLFLNSMSRGSPTSDSVKVANKVLSGSPKDNFHSTSVVTNSQSESSTNDGFTSVNTIDLQQVESPNTRMEPFVSADGFLNTDPASPSSNSFVTLANGPSSSNNENVVVVKKNSSPLDASSSQSTDVSRDNSVNTGDTLLDSIFSLPQSDTLTIDPLVPSMDHSTNANVQESSAVIGSNTNDGFLTPVTIGQASLIDTERQQNSAEPKMSSEHNVDAFLDAIFSLPQSDSSPIDSSTQPLKPTTLQSSEVFRVVPDLVTRKSDGILQNNAEVDNQPSVQNKGDQSELNLESFFPGYDGLRTSSWNPIPPLINGNNRQRHGTVVVELKNIRSASTRLPVSGQTVGLGGPTYTNVLSTSSVHAAENPVVKGTPWRRLPRVVSRNKSGKTNQDRTQTATTPKPPSLSTNLSLRKLSGDSSSSQAHPMPRTDQGFEIILLSNPGSVGERPRVRSGAKSQESARSNRFSRPISDPVASVSPHVSSTARGRGRGLRGSQFPFDTTGDPAIPTSFTFDRSPGSEPFGMPRSLSPRFGTSSRPFIPRRPVVPSEFESRSSTIGMPLSPFPTIPMSTSASTGFSSPTGPLPSAFDRPTGFSALATPFSGSLTMPMSPMFPRATPFSYSDFPRRFMGLPSSALFSGSRIPVSTSLFPSFYGF